MTSGSGPGFYCIHQFDDPSKYQVRLRPGFHTFHDHPLGKMQVDLRDTSTLITELRVTTTRGNESQLRVFLVLYSYQDTMHVRQKCNPLRYLIELLSMYEFFSSFQVVSGNSGWICTFSKGISA